MNMQTQVAYIVFVRPGKHPASKVMELLKMIESSLPSDVARLGTFLAHENAHARHRSARRMASPRLESHDRCMLACRRPKG